MDLRTFWKSLTPDRKKRFAADIGTTPGHFNNMTGGTATVSPRLAAQIELHSRRWQEQGWVPDFVPRASLRDDAADIWHRDLPPIEEVTTLHQVVTMRQPATRRAAVPAEPMPVRRPSVVSRRALGAATDVPCDMSSPTRLICGDRRARDRDGDPVEERRTLVRNIERAIAGATGNRER